MADLNLFLVPYTIRNDETIRYEFVACLDTDMAIGTIQRRFGSTISSILIDQIIEINEATDYDGARYNVQLRKR